MRRRERARAFGVSNIVLRFTISCYTSTMIAHALLLGLTLGVRHAFEPDHLAAITTLLARNSGARAAAETGAAWGLGHAGAVILLGGAIVATGLRIPSALAVGLDLAVGGMLLVLAGQAFFRARARASGGEFSESVAPSATAAHPHEHDAAPGRRRGSTLVGFVHGASGSAAITLLCLTTFRSRAHALAFLLVFALGALASMSALSGLIAAPLAAIARRGHRAERAMLVAGGVLALAAAVAVVVTAVASPGAT